MLGKLMKYDLKSLGANILPTYLCMLVVAVVDCVLQILKTSDFMSDAQAVRYIANTTHTMVFIGVVCLFFVLLLIGTRYYKNNIMEDEGYLMHTLPVSSYQLLASKVITFMVFVLITAVVSYLTVVIATREPFLYKQLYDIFFFGTGKTKAVLFGILFFMLLYFLFLILAAYLAFSVGYSSVRKARNFVAGGIFVLLYVLGKIGELLVVYNLGRRGVMDLEIEEITTTDLMWLGIPLIILYLVLSGACFGATGKWLEKHLNLD